MESLHTLIYLSTAVSELSDLELKDILSESKKNNSEKNISGILIYCDGNILQVLEGLKQDLYSLYTKIGLDPRHKGLIVLQDRSIDSRSFADWSMGFKSATKAEFIEIEGYLDLRKQLVIDNSNNSSVAKTILTGFIENNR